MPPASDLLFRRLLKELRPKLADYGFRRRSQNFVIESSQCWGVINFQKSLYSSAQEKRFTVNVAIAAKAVLRFYNEPDDKPPLHYKCHWEVRLGQLIPGRSDQWWTLSDRSSYSPIASEVENHIVELAVPMIRDHLTEEGLLELWNSKHFGGFEYPVLKYKSILLAERGELDKLPAIFDRILKICHEGPAHVRAEEHVAHLRRRYHQIQ